MERGRYTGNNYRPVRTQTMLRPVVDVTQFATGFPQQQPASGGQALPPAPVDPAYIEWMRGNDSRGTYEGPGILEEDDSNYRAEQMDLGMPLYD